MLQFSLVFMPQERGPRQKTRLMTDFITFGVGNSKILNQDGKTKILSYVACFYSKCLAKIVFLASCLLTIFIIIIDTSVLLENIPLEKFTKTTSGTRVVYFQLSHTWVYRWRNFRNFHPKFVGVLHLLNFTYTFSKALLIFCHSAQCYFWRLL